MPTIAIAGLTSAQKKALRIADNKIPLEATWNADQLAIELEEIGALDIDFDFTLTGFEIPEIDLIFENALEIVSDSHSDVFPVVDDHASLVTKRGDLWLLDDHRVHCGDARNGEDYFVLMNGTLAQIAITDAPFNVRIDGHVGGKGSIKHHEFMMASGEMSDDEYSEFLDSYVANMAKFSEPASVHYHFIDWRHHGQLECICLKHYSDHLNTCIWVKGNGGMGSLYRSQHEIVLVMKNGPGSHINNVQLGKFGRNRTNVWNYAGINSFGPERDEQLAMHPTTKPVTLVADAILDCSRRGDIVLDPFLGSGTTIIAAERTGRRAFGMEIDPVYIDTAIRRWQTYSGSEAVHAESGKTFHELEHSRNWPSRTRLIEPESS